MDDTKNVDLENNQGNPEQSEATPREASPLDVCRVQLAQAKERYMYLQAEFDNYKKRLEKERTSWIDAAQDVVIVDVLSTVDDMDRALQELQALPKELSVHLAGFEMIAKSLHKILKKYDVEEIPYSKTFNPEYCEAVMQVASPDHQSGEVVSILQKGSMRKGRVLRPAKVSVAQ